MTYAIEFTEIRTYEHTVFINASDEREALDLAGQLMESSTFLCDRAGCGAYEDTELELASVYELEATKWDTVLTEDEVNEYIEG